MKIGRGQLEGKGGETEEARKNEKNQAQQVVLKRCGVSKDNTWGTINRSTGP